MILRSDVKVMGYLQCIYCICACINRGVNLLHPLSLQCQLLLRLIPLHQNPLRTHACISPAHPRCRHTHLRCHSAPLYCTANNYLQVCSNIASGCTFYWSETLTCLCGCFAAHASPSSNCSALVHTPWAFAEYTCSKCQCTLLFWIESATCSNAINTSNWVNIMYTIITTSMVSMAANLWWQKLVRHLQEEVLDHFWLVYLTEGQSDSLLLYVCEVFQKFY